MAVRSLDRSIDEDPLARRVVQVVGLVFVLASLPKFVTFGWELEQFERFGLPFPEVFVIAAGAFELLGGLALIRRQRILPVALLLSMTMVVAIVASGILQGDVVPSLTVAPALLAALVFLTARGLRLA